MLILKYVKDERRRCSQKASWPFGESHLWPDAALFLSHIAGLCSSVTPCLGLKARTPNRACYFATDPKGFSLLEVLVAIVVLSVVLGLIISLFGGGLRSVSLTNGYSEALLLAREKLDEEMVLIDIEEEDEGGESNGYRWERNIEAVFLNEEDSGKDPSLFQVSVKISWEEGIKEKELALQTLVAARN